MAEGSAKRRIHSRLSSHQQSRQGKKPRSRDPVRITFPRALEPALPEGLDFLIFGVIFFSANCVPGRSTQASSQPAANASRLRNLPPFLLDETWYGCSMNMIGTCLHSFKAVPAQYDDFVRLLVDRRFLALLDDIGYFPWRFLCGSAHLHISVFYLFLQQT